METVRLVNNLIQHFTHNHNYQKIYWTKNIKKYPNGQTHSNPLSKIHKEGIQYLESMKWTKIHLKLHKPIIPIFSLTTRKEVHKYESCLKYKSYELPFIRQLPHHITNLLDNKKLLWLKMQSNGYANCMPQTFSDIETFIQTQLKHHCIHKGENIWYLKHIKGCKGRSIHLFNDIKALKTFFHSKNSKMNDFIIQKEVNPMLTIENRKFAIRSHVLITLNNTSQLAVFFHKQSIVLPNAKCYDSKNISDKSIHIQQIGKKFPKPFLLDDETSRVQLTHIDSNNTFKQMCDITKKVFLCIEKEVIAFGKKCEYENIIGKYYHLFGFDFMIDKNEKVFLLEINSFPAIGNGTMSNVNKMVFTQLIKDLVSIVVLPVVDKQYVIGNNNKYFEQIISNECDYQLP